MKSLSPTSRTVLPIPQNWVERAHSPDLVINMPLSLDLHKVVELAFWLEAPLRMSLRHLQLTLTIAANGGQVAIAEIKLPETNIQTEMVGIVFFTFKYSTVYQFQSITQRQEIQVTHLCNLRSWHRQRLLLTQTNPNPRSHLRWAGRLPLLHSVVLRFRQIWTVYYAPVPHKRDLHVRCQVLDLRPLRRDRPRVRRPRPLKVQPPNPNNQKWLVCPGAGYRTTVSVQWLVVVRRTIITGLIADRLHLKKENLILNPR